MAIREGYIIEEIVEYSNMSDAFDEVLRGTERKKCSEGRYLLAHREQVLQKLSNGILKGHLPKARCYFITVREGGKDRRIAIYDMTLRIAENAVMRVVDRHIRNRYIRTTAASIKKRGMHDLSLYMRRDIAENPEGTRYAYQFDLKSFYDMIEGDFIMSCVRHLFKDKRLIDILSSCVYSHEGLVKGRRSSQSLANLLLSVHLDHYLKDELGVRYFYRYCDDGLVLSHSKEYLWQIRNLIHQRMNTIHLTVKPNERVYPITEGIDMLGYVVYPDHVRIRKRVKKNCARKLHEVKSRKRRKEVIASFYGMAKHSNSKHLFQILTGKNMEESFKDFKNKQAPFVKDGKKRFRGPCVSLRTLLNKTVTILDFERDIKTENGMRWLVSVDDGGVLKKYFTDDKEMEYDLECLEKANKLPSMPITIGWDDSNGFGHYIFT